MYYYKQIDILGNITALLTCSIHLEESESQIEIAGEEYNQLLEKMEVSEDAELPDISV